MPDEENDIRIREAADNYHPAYDDTAWDKMEKLLDEHLPQKKRRRKFFFLLPFLLLMSGLILFMVSNNGGKNSSETSRISIPKNHLVPKLNETNQSPVNATEKSIEKPENEPVTSEKNKSDLQIILDNSRKAITGKAKIVSVPATANNIDGQHNHKENLPAQSNILLMQGSNEEGNYKNKILNNETNPSTPSNNESLNENNNISGETENKTEQTKTNNQTTVTGKTEIKEQVTIAKITNAKSEINKKKTENKNRFKNNFGITLSVGPAISGVSNAGKVTFLYGTGLSYSISKKFTIRTGFYMSRKIYSVGPYGYHFPNGSGSNYDYLQSVDANCNVDEIPLNLYYSFGKVKNHNWFASAGLSSYLMKKESYEFYYKTTTGDTYENDWSIKNKNKNIFSVLNLSVGYQHTFNKQFSIMAEPYINLPLSGIGAGKVKLNSGGILFTITMKPFLKTGE